MAKENVIGTIKVGDDPFFEVVDKGDAHLEIRFVYEPERGLRIPKKLVNALTEILKAYDGRRRRPRYAYCEQALIETNGSRVKILGKTTDISEDGVFVNSLAVLPRGTEVQVKIPPKKARLQASALVRNVREGIGMGLEFRSLSPKTRAKLVRLVESCSEHVIG